MFLWEVEVWSLTDGFCLVSGIFQPIGTHNSPKFLFVCPFQLRFLLVLQQFYPTGVNYFEWRTECFNLNRLPPSFWNLCYVQPCYMKTSVWSASNSWSFVDCFSWMSTTNSVFIVNPVKKIVTKSQPDYVVSSKAKSQSQSCQYTNGRRFPHEEMAEIDLHHGSIQKECCKHYKYSQPWMRSPAAFRW